MVYSHDDSSADQGHDDKYRAVDEISDVASSTAGESQNGSETGDYAKAGTTVTSNLSMSSPAALRNLRHMRTTRKRVPGGAAAKLIGRGAEADGNTRLVEQYINDDGGGLEVVAPTAELDTIRQKAKEEFKMGTTSNRRYHTPHARRPGQTIEQSMSEASLPSILNRTEVFHESAAAAVVSLLAPRSGRAMSDAGSVFSTRSHTDDAPGSPKSPPLSPPRSPTKGSQSSAFQPPPKRDDGASVISYGTAPPGMMSDFSNDNNFERFDSVRSPTEQPMLSRKAEKFVEEMASKMRDPNKQLSDLLSAIATPEDGNIDRGFMVRRKNACGALQVLTAKQVHRVKICWTVGVLPALTSLLEDAGDEGLEIAFPDIPTRLEYIDARKRAIASLMNLSMPKENRLAVFHSPRLVSSVIQVINEDTEESRRGCCAVLAYLGKTPENRILMVQVPGLVDAITAIIKPKPVLDDDENSAGSDSHSDGDPDFGASTSGTRSGTFSGSGSGEATEHNESYLSEEEKEGSTVGVSTFGSSPSETHGDIATRYDNDPNEFLHGARQSIFALLFHLLKEKDNAFHLARHNGLTDTLVEISKMHESPSHVFAVKLLAHLTRHRNNSKPIVFRLRSIVPALVNATYSDDGESRKYACYALQNLAQDKPCRQELAITNNLLSALCYRARQGGAPEERLAAIHALKNLTDEPANLIPMTNTPECFATLMQIAHASDDSITEKMQYLGCDALATLSHWFRSIATSGQRIEALKHKQTPSKDLFVPSLKIVAWQQWQ